MEYTYSQFLGCARKKQYETKKTADKIAVQMKKKYKINFRSYECEHCKMWHVTKK